MKLLTKKLLLFCMMCHSILLFGGNWHLSALPEGKNLNNYETDHIQIIWWFDVSGEDSTWFCASSKQDLCPETYQSNINISDNSYGYWIYSTQNEFPTFDFTESDNINPLSLSNMKEGWNLISTKEYLDISSVANTEEIDIVWAYENEEWLVYIPQWRKESIGAYSFNNISKLSKEKGYWFLLNTVPETTNSIEIDQMKLPYTLYTSNGEEYQFSYHNELSLKLDKEFTIDFASLQESGINVETFSTNESYILESNLDGYYEGTYDINNKNIVDYEDENVNLTLDILQSRSLIRLDINSKSLKYKSYMIIKVNSSSEISYYRLLNGEMSLIDNSDIDEFIEKFNHDFTKDLKSKLLEQEGLYDWEEFINIFTKKEGE